MTEYKGQQAMSISVSAGDVICINYDLISSLNIVNLTEGAIFVSEENDFEVSNNVGNFLTITDGNSYNEYFFYKNKKNKIYIKSDANGIVSVVRKQW